jgi:hypothetical protein
MRNGLCTPAKVWVWFHRHHQHIIQNFFRITAVGDPRITATGDTRITADSDY